MALAYLVTPMFNPDSSLQQPSTKTLLLHPPQHSHISEFDACLVSRKTKRIALTPGSAQSKYGRLFRAMMETF